MGMNQTTSTINDIVQCFEVSYDKCTFFVASINAGW